MDKRQIAEAYDRFAPWYDLVEGVPDWLLGIRGLRRRVLARARGRVLEVAAGTGRNLPHYPARCRLTAVDLSGGMLARLRRRLAEAGRGASVARMDTQALAFPDGVFDTVVDTMALCTYPDPRRALREMSRVCRPDGRILLVEHGRSRLPALARFQDRHDRWLVESVGCHWNRDPLELVETAGLSVRAVRRTVAGVFYALTAAPAS